MRENNSLKCYNQARSQIKTSGSQRTKEKGKSSCVFFKETERWNQADWLAKGYKSLNIVESEGTSGNNIIFCLIAKYEKPVLYTILFWLLFCLSFF